MARGSSVLSPRGSSFVYPHPRCCNRRGNVSNATRQRAANSNSPGAGGQLGSAPAVSICQPAGRAALQPAAAPERGAVGLPRGWVMGSEQNGRAPGWHLALPPVLSSVPAPTAGAVTGGGSPGRAGRCGGPRAVNAAPGRERVPARVSCSPPPPPTNRLNWFHLFRAPLAGGPGVAKEPPGDSPEAAVLGTGVPHSSPSLPQNQTPRAAGENLPHTGRSGESSFPHERSRSRPVNASFSLGSRGE